MRSAYIFGKISSSHSLRALSAVFGLSSFGLEEYLKEIRNNMYCYLPLTLELINLVSYVPIDLSGIEEVLDVKAPAMGDILCTSSPNCYSVFPYWSFVKQVCFISSDSD